MNDFDVTDYLDGDDIDDEDFLAQEQEEEAGPELDLLNMTNAIDVTAEEIGAMGREMLCSIIEQQPTNDNDERWTQAAEWLFNLCKNEIESPFEVIANRLCSTVIGESIPFENRSQAFQLTWSAIARYMIALIMAEEREDLQAAQDYDWRQWIAERTKQTESEEESESDDN